MGPCELSHSRHNCENQRFSREKQKARPDLKDRAFTLFRSSVPQIFADVDNSAVLKLGVPIADVNTTLGSFFGGSYVNDFNRFGRLFQVRVQAEPEYRTKE